MPVIAVVNRKGGSGKSTFAAHVAAWCALQGHSAMLGDVDRQQSTRAWLKRRDPCLPLISPWAMDNKNVLRVPAGITHVVLDTPGGIHGFELARVVMFADAIVMPVCASMFDRESAAACHAELMTLPRVASGRCRLAVVGMRIDGRTRAAEALAGWSKNLGIAYLGALRETQLYVRSLERGMTIFDLPTQIAAADLAQWDPIICWLKPVLQPPQAANDALPTRAPSARLGLARPDNLMPAQESLIHGTRLMIQSGARAALAPQAQPARVLPRGGIEGGQIQRFLKP
jgi:chromosome partitioning protein